jgi:uncharacterized protein YndB with AHSA1/START domain
MRIVIAAAFAAAILCPATATAEVASSSSSAFVVSAEAEVAAAPEAAWTALLEIGQWWSPAHTFSGDAANLSLDAQAGGCWCERWGDGQSVEHARVVAVTSYEGVRALRAVGGLGPLQELGVSGVMTFTVAPVASGAKITMTYRVSGDASLGLDQVAPLVDGVLMEQFGRLNRYSASGSAN